MKIQRNEKRSSAEELIGSSAMKAFLASINAGETVEIARLRADVARSLQNIEDLHLGLPPLAAGKFLCPVATDWADMGELNALHSEYISGSGTRYLMYQGEIIARLQTEATRSEW